MNEAKERPDGITIIAGCWALVSMFAMNQAVQTLIWELPFFPFDPSAPEWISFALPAEIVLSFSVIVLGVLTVLTAYGLFTGKSWSFKPAFVIPVLAVIIYGAAATLYASAPAELFFDPEFTFYLALIPINLVWIVMIMVYLRKPNVKQFIIGSLSRPISPKAPPFSVSIPHAGTWKGDVIKAILLQGHPLTWRELSEATSLDEKPLNRALYELISSEEIHKVDGKYNVSRKILSAYLEFPNQRRTELISWINQWKDVRKLKFSLEHEHFFLEGRHLDDFSKELISHAKSEVVIVNPFIQDCDLSNTLREAKKRGINVQILTRQPRDKYREQLE